MNSNTAIWLSVPMLVLAWLAGAFRFGLIVGCGLLLAAPALGAEHPFKGRINGQFLATPTSNPAVYLGSAQAVGKSTDIGAFRKLTSDVTNIATGELEGSFTMTGANGDLVTGVYSGILLFGSTPGTFAWILGATITGGTGRFSHATGTFVFVAEGEFVLVDGAVHGEYGEIFEGTIDY